MVQHRSELELTTKVFIDGDKSLTGTVTAVIFRYGAVFYEVSYIHNGGSYSPTIEAWRVNRVPFA